VALCEWERCADFLEIKIEVESRIVNLSLNFEG
jgi:hypothetical protein